MKTIVLSFLFVATGIVSQAQLPLFSQNFNTSSTLTDYFNTNAPGTGQFNGYANALVSSGQTAPILSITNNRLYFDKSASTAAPALSVTRSAKFIDTPQVVQLECDLEVTNMTSGSTIAFTVELGNTFSPTTAGTLSSTTVHSQFALATNTTAGINGFQVRSISGATTSPTIFTGQQHITWIVNNSAVTCSYTAPDGSTQTVGVDKWDIWVGNTLVFDESPARNPTPAITNLRITISAGSEAVSVDNLLIKALDLPVNLPVNITSFTGTASNQGVQLNWATATEINNDHFTIERSADAITYNPLVTIPAKGTAANYTVTDDHPLDGINYYRLVQYDKDGTRSYQGTVAVHVASTPTVTFSAYPNPAKDHFTLNVGHYTGKNLSLAVRDLTGKTLFTQTIATNSVQSLYNISLPGNMVSGLYFLELTGEGLHQSIKLMVQ